MKIVFKKPTQKDFIKISLFLLSFIHPLFIILFLTFLMLDSLNSIENGLKGLILIAIRTIINPLIAIDIASVQMFKYVAIFAISTLIILNSRNYKINYRVKNFIYLEILLCLYIVLDSIFFSSYPLVSIFKCFSYGYVFICVVIGVSCTIKIVNWTDVLYRYLEKIILFSVISIPFSFAYYSSAHWFRGITNQSQMFAIMASLFSAIVLLKMMSGNRNRSQYFLMLIILVLTYLSGSRTGMLATSVCLVYAYYVEVIKNKNTMLLFLSIIIGLLFFIFFSNSIIEIIRDFMLKGNSNTTTDITFGTVAASREGQLTIFLEKLKTNKWFGTGFMVPYVNNHIQDWSFSFGLLVENGNLIYSVLGDLGIIGFLLFTYVYGYMFFVGEKRKGNFILFLAPFVVCMGEMIFFSTNNNAILLYMMLSTYLCDCSK